MTSRLIIPLILLVIMVSCEQVNVPVEKTYEVASAPAVIEEDEEEIEDPVEVEIMEVLAISVYQNYVVSGKNVFGINGSKLEPIEFASKEGGKLSPVVFFKKSGKVYFSIQTFEPGETDQSPSVEKMLYFSQENDNISVVASLPACPESDRVEYESAPYWVKKTTYGEIATSTVMRGTTQTAYLCIDAASKVDGGLWFSVPESYQSRLKGVYYYAVDANICRKLAEGRIF